MKNPRFTRGFFLPKSKITLPNPDQPQLHMIKYQSVDFYPTQPNESHSFKPIKNHPQENCLHLSKTT